MNPVSKIPIDVRALVKHALSFPGTDTPGRLEINTDFKQGLWKIEVEESQLLQALTDILGASIHATGSAGTLNITARNFVLNDPATSVAFDCQPGHYVILTIAVDGVGIAESDMDLAFTRETVKEQGGHVSFTSAEKQGTAFSLYLPRHHQHDIDFDTRLVTPAPGVLVVEDEELIRNLVMTLCEKNGYRTFAAADGIEALECIKEHGDEIFVAVIDIAMPRMTGTELFKHMVRSGIDIPVIVASGFLVDAKKIAEETGGTPCAIFAKPYQLTELIVKIDELRDHAGLVIAS